MFVRKEKERGRKEAGFLSARMGMVAVIAEWGGMTARLHGPVGPVFSSQRLRRQTLSLIAGDFWVLFHSLPHF